MISESKTLQEHIIVEDCISDDRSQIWWRKSMLSCKIDAVYYSLSYEI